MSVRLIDVSIHRAEAQASREERALTGLYRSTTYRITVSLAFPGACARRPPAHAGLILTTEDRYRGGVIFVDDIACCDLEWRSV